MLMKNKTISKGEIVSLKLISGEELISKYISEDTDNICIDSPLVLTISDKGQIGMIPWMILSSTYIYTLSRNHILAMSLSNNDAKEKFIEASKNFKMEE